MTVSATIARIAKAEIQKELGCPRTSLVQREEKALAWYMEMAAQVASPSLEAAS